MGSSQNEFKENLRNIADRAVDIWTSMVMQLGLSESDAGEWKKSYLLQVQNSHDQLIKEVNVKRDNVIKSIESLLAEAQVLCMALEVPMPSFGSQNLGLYQERKEIVEHVRRMQEKWDKRIVEVKELLAKQKDLCTALQRTPIEICLSSLPSKDVFDNLRQYINKLEQELFDRTEKFIKLKCECLEYAEKVKYSPNETFETCILKGNDKSFAVSVSNLEQLEQFHSKLSICYQNMFQEINELRVRQNDLWNLLEEDCRYCKSFTEKHDIVNYDTLLALKKEISRCDDIKRVNMQKFIEKHRKEIVDMWDKCFYGEAERNEFVEHLHDDLYTGELLELHKLELNRLNTFFEENSNLISLIKSRNDLWEEILMFEEVASDSNRFQNRGGKLLLEEKKRKTFQKKLPNIETKICELAANFESRYGKNFLYFGRNIVEIIVESHAGHEQDKKLRLSARKQERFLSPTNLPISRNPNSGGKNSSKRHMHKTDVSPSTSEPAYSNQRRAQTSPKENRAGTRKELKICLNNKTICKTKLFFSTQKKKNSERYKRICATVKKQAGSNLLEYDEFQTRVPARSTMTGATSPMAVPLPISPK